ncbi:MAG: hypothetical protein JRH16_02940 [Deltaproteobacteria bacterium]|nr:hypothetical protein [Deltaproteobacteria bacterium]MBW2362225.1 hypothetical protein [Deltaproteobacteria bacterium]
MSSLPRSIATAVLSLSLAGTATAGASITGVCPDGSMFVVRQRADIPCPESKEVEPHDLPPIRPAYLPRPYGWQVFQNKQDPNNPYNLVDRAQTIREAGEPIEDSPAPRPQRAQPEPQRHAALPPLSAPPPSAPPALRLSAEERRNLALIVELSQKRSAARFAGEDAPLVIELAHSRAFEERLHAHYAGEPLGPVVLFSAAASTAASFHANFTFVQGHEAYHPRADDPRRLGLLTGELGPLATGESVLGYAVLPAQTDLTLPIDIYWNDRRISVAFSH